MASPGKKPFLLRLDPKVFDALEEWAHDEFRSVNAQVEYLLFEALRKAGRKPKPKQSNAKGDASPADAVGKSPEKTKDSE